MQRNVKTAQVTIFPGVPLVALDAQSMFNFGKQPFSKVEVFGNHRNFDDGAKFKQMLFDEVLPRLAAASTKDEKKQPG